VTVVKHSFRCKYKGNETHFVHLKQLFVKKVRICSLQYLIFQRLLDFNYSPLSALNEANLTSATQTLNFNPTMHYQIKTSQPD
jgi:hypothetical protein